MARWCYQRLSCAPDAWSAQPVDRRLRRRLQHTAQRQQTCRGGSWAQIALRCHYSQSHPQPSVSQLPLLRLLHAGGHEKAPSCTFWSHPNSRLDKVRGVIVAWIVPPSTSFWLVFSPPGICMPSIASVVCTGMKWGFSSRFYCCEVFSFTFLSFDGVMVPI